MSATKRARLTGEFSPLYPPTSSPTALISNDAQIDTIMLDGASERHGSKGGVEGKPSGEQDTKAQPDMVGGDDVEMSDLPKSDWHLAEPTAHPDAILQYINSDRGPLYFLRCTSKAFRCHLAQSLLCVCLAEQRVDS
jgi:hypothetical protein